MPSLDPDPGWITAGALERPLSLHGSALQALRRRAAQEYPREACGLLVGCEWQDRVDVLEAPFARNLERVRLEDRFWLDPADHLRLAQAAEARGLAVVGVWHSHPNHPARPSRTDQQAAWPGWSYLIVSVGAAGALDLRSWRLDAAGSFLEEPLETPQP